MFMARYANLCQPKLKYEFNVNSKSTCLIDTNFQNVTTIFAHMRDVDTRNFIHQTFFTNTQIKTLLTKF